MCLTSYPSASSTLNLIVIGSRLVCEGMLSRFERTMYLGYVAIASCALLDGGWSSWSSIHSSKLDDKLYAVGAGSSVAA